MALRDPYAAYNAASNLEAHVVCNILREAGLEALAIEDVSTGELVPRPQVWIERANIELAKPVLDEFERQGAERKRSSSDSPRVAVICEVCGTRSLFPASQFGTVQSCSHCHAFVDVGDDSPFEGWEGGPESGADETE